MSVTDCIKVGEKLTYNKKIILFLAFLLILSSVSLASENFRASAPKEIELCACSDSPYLIKITNTGYLIQKTEIYNGDTEKFASKLELPAKYKINVHGSAAEFFTLSSSVINLAGGEERNIYGHIKAPCDIEGVYDLFIDIESETLKKRISSKVIIKRYSNVKLTAIDNDKTIDPCDPVSYSFTIRNRGNFIEEYELSVDNLGERISFSENPVIVGEMSSKLVNMYIDPSCNALDSAVITLGVQAKKSRYYSEIPFFLRVNDEYYDYDIVLGDSVYEFCQGTDISIPFKVINNIDKRNTVQLKIDGAKFGSLGSEYIILEPGTNVLDILLDIPADQEGRFEFIISGKSEIQDILKSVSFFVDVVACHGIVFNDRSLYVNYSDQTVFASVTHLASREQTYELQITGPEWLTLQYDNITLGPWETKEIMLQSMPNETLLEGKYPVFLTAVLDDDVSYSRKMNVILTENAGLAEKIMYTPFGLYLAFFIFDIILIILGILLLKNMMDKRRPKQKTLKEIEKIEKNKLKVTVTEESNIPEKTNTFFSKNKTCFIIIAALILLAIIVTSSFIIYDNIIGANHTVEMINDTLPVNESIALNETIALNRTIDDVIINETANKTSVNWTAVSETAVNGTVVDRAETNFSGMIAMDIVNESEVSNISIVDNIIDGISDSLSKTKGILNTGFENLWSFMLTGLVFLYSYKWFIISGIVMVAAIILIIIYFRTKQEKPKKKKERSRWWIYVLMIIGILIIAGLFLYADRSRDEVENITIDIDTLNNISKDYGADGPEVIDDAIDEIVEDIDKIIIEEEIIDDDVKDLEELIEVEEVMHEGVTEADIDALNGSHFRWDMNTNLSINLNNMFVDPDEDILRFSATKIENISSEFNLNAGSVTLIPNENWTGIAWVWFTADDEKGGITTSDKIYLVVTEPSEKTVADMFRGNSILFMDRFKGFFRDYAYYIIMGFIILLILILITRYNRHLTKFFDDEQSYDYLERMEQEEKIKKNAAAAKKNAAKKKKVVKKKKVAKK